MTIEIFLAVCGLLLPVIGSIITIFVRNETRAAKFDQRLKTSEDRHAKGDGVIEKLSEAVVELRIAIQSFAGMSKRD